MEANIKTQLDRYKELVEKVCSYADKTQKKTAFENISGKINALIHDTISSNLQAVQDYTKFYFQNYVTCKYHSSEGIDNLIHFVNSNIKEIQIFENDSEEIRQERKLKYEQFRQVIKPKEKVVKRIITNGILTEEIKEADPDWIYTEYGTYTKYLSFKSHRYFPICLNIKKSGLSDFETVNYLVLLYIALNNELCLINEELELSGIVSQTHSNMNDLQHDTNRLNTKGPQRTIDVEKLKPYFNSTFKGMGNNNINYFDWLIDHLKTERTPKAFAQIALMIYESKSALNKTKPNTFKNWYSVFCDSVGCEQKTYQPKDLRTPSDTIKSTFNYL